MSAPNWIDGLFVWENGQTRALADFGPRIAEEQLRDEIDDFANSLTTAASRHERPESRIVQMDGKAMAMLGRLTRCPGTPQRPVVAVGLAAISDLPQRLAEPFLAPDSGLELAPLSQVVQPWAQSLPWPLHEWVVQPTGTFLSAQRAGILRHTLTYVGLTVLALGTLLAAMWMLFRVAQREVTLAELKSNFVADVSHELKTPLAMIQLFAETLQSGRVADEEKKSQYYGIIARESTRLSHLINNILDFSRIEAGRKEYSFQSTNVGEVVQQTYETYRAELDRLGFEHHVTLASNLPRVDADRGAITQVLVNLISNVMKYSAEDRFLAIHVERDTRRGRRGVLVSLEDRGIGIRPEDRARIFEGFFRSTDGRVQRQGGTGLGLALVKQIVDAHSGSIDVESRLVKGTAFRVFLPAAENASPP
jgi:signal transduction histidine kinase